MKPKGFSDISRLEDDDLRRLLGEGDAQERVWAAWAIGLRLGAESIPVLRQSVGDHPDPGTRRHIIVVLAGHGQLDVLRAMAADDPSEAVRATACQHLVGTALPPDEPLVEFLEQRLVADPGPEVRRMILAQLTPELGPLARETLAMCNSDVDPEVRRLAAKQLRARFPLESLYPDPFGLRIEADTNADLAMTLCRWALEIDRTSLLLDVALRADEGRAQLVLDRKSPWVSPEQLPAIPL